MIEVTNQKGGQRKVVFSLPHDDSIQSACVVGDFNDWDGGRHPMKRRGSGPWRTSLVLDPGEHQFRYLVNGDEWRNDEDADRCGNPYGGENSLAKV